MNNSIKTEAAPEYVIKKPTLTISDDDIIAKALGILESRITATAYNITSPEDTKSYLKIKMGEYEQEVFSVIFLNTLNYIIECDEMFYGTVNTASVYPREIIKKALKLNASAIIIAHNHPSGNPEPSDADERITIRIKEACELMDITLLDHIIIGNPGLVSLAERGLV